MKLSAQGEHGGFTDTEAANLEITKVAELGEAYLRDRTASPVSRDIGLELIAERLARYDFSRPQSMIAVAADVLDLLGVSGLRTDNPRYFGLFNPPALPEAIAGDLLTAIVNPQLAVRSHSPGAAALEDKLVAYFGSVVGWPVGTVAGGFTSGGSEANLTAALVALSSRYSSWPDQGIAGATLRPAIYCSANAHMAWKKIARVAGLGSEAVRLVETDDGLKLTSASVERALEADQDRFDPFLIVGTAGTTSHGAIDDLVGLSRLARTRNTHFHVDAAWAGGTLFIPSFRPLFDGIKEADSVTIDPHKMLAVPMGAGLYLGRHWRGLETAFAVDASYMPPVHVSHRDPYAHSLQWSRRLIGLKLFMVLAVRGAEGLGALLAHQVQMGDRLREGLLKNGWRVVNATPLPLICFTNDADDDAFADRVRDHVVESGAAWLSTVVLRGRRVLRACITSYQAGPEDIDFLLILLEEARRQALGLAAPRRVCC